MLRAGAAHACPPPRPRLAPVARAAAVVRAARAPCACRSAPLPVCGRWHALAGPRADFEGQRCANARHAPPARPPRPARRRSRPQPAGGGGWTRRSAPPAPPPAHTTPLTRPHTPRLRAPRASECVPHTPRGRPTTPTHHRGPVGAVGTLHSPSRRPYPALRPIRPLPCPAGGGLQRPRRPSLRARDGPEWPTHGPLALPAQPAGSGASPPPSGPSAPAATLPAPGARYGPCGPCGAAALWGAQAAWERPQRARARPLGALHPARAPSGPGGRCRGRTAALRRRSRPATARGTAAIAPPRPWGGQRPLGRAQAARTAQHAPHKLCAPGGPLLGASGAPERSAVAPPSRSRSGSPAVPVRTPARSVFMAVRAAMARPKRPLRTPRDVGRCMCAGRVRVVRVSIV